MGAGEAGVDGTGVGVDVGASVGVDVRLAVGASLVVVGDGRSLSTVREGDAVARLVAGEGRGEHAAPSRVTATAHGMNEEIHFFTFASSLPYSSTALSPVVFSRPGVCGRLSALEHSNGQRNGRPILFGDLLVCQLMLRQYSLT